jgi:hypothetical protein
VVVKNYGENPGHRQFEQKRGHGGEGHPHIDLGPTGRDGIVGGRDSGQVTMVIDVRPFTSWRLAERVRRGRPRWRWGPRSC